MVTNDSNPARRANRITGINPADGSRFASSKVAATLGLWESFISRMGLILGGVTSPADAIPDLERLMRDVLRSVFDTTLGAEWLNLDAPRELV